MDSFHVAKAPIAALAADRKMTGEDVTRATKLYKVDADKPNPIGV
jgi:pyruvate dehydrogenase E1 component